jgi:hypothetical protein
MKRLRSPILAFVIVAALAAAACSDADRKKLAQADDDFARGLQTALALDDSMIKGSLISKDDALTLTTALLDLSRLSQEFHNNAKTYGLSGGSTKADLLKLASGMSASLATLNAQGVLRIKNPDSKTQFLGAMAVLNTALGVLTAVLGGLK